MSTEQLLDACDLHLIYLRPGIFGELTLKKGKSTSMLFSSPPEFPTWTPDMVQGNILDMPCLEGFVDSKLLKTYLNINNDDETLDTTALNNIDINEANINTGDEETSVLKPNKSFVLNGGNIDVDLNGGNDESTTKSGNESMTLNGGNTTNCLNGGNDEPTQTGENSVSAIAYEDYDDEWNHTMDTHPEAM